MAIKYNKEIRKKDGRRLFGGGPRDLQKRQMQQTSTDGSVVVVLTEEIAKLRKELQDVNNTSFTAEQVDEDINKVVGKTIEELTTKHREESKQRQSNFDEAISNSNALMVELKEQNKFLTEKLCEMKKTTDPEILNKLTTLFTEVTEKMTLNSTTVPDRPQMETVFIDPLEAGVEDGLESHINIKDTPVTSKGNIQDKVSKLKNLLGNLKT